MVTLNSGSFADFAIECLADSASKDQMLLFAILISGDVLFGIV